MSKNITIDGRELTGVTALKVLDTETQQLVSFHDTSDADAEASDINAGKTAYVNGSKLVGTNTGAEANDLDGIIDGTLAAFIMPTGKVKILQYRFQNFTALLSANLGGANEVGQYAFDGCTKIANFAPPASLVIIGAYAFRNVGNGQNTTFILSPSAACAVGSYAFNGAKIAKVLGKYGAIASYAFSSCNSLNEIDIEECSGVSDYAFQNDYYVTKLHANIVGAVGSYAFYNLYNVADCDLSASDLKSLGNYAFSRFAGNRATPESNIIVLDLRNSTFTSIPQYGFGGDSSTNTYKNRYMRIFFPSTVNAINAYAFRYSDNCDFYFSSVTPPTLSVTTAWENATNYNILVPFSAINAYRTATNWSAKSSYIKGYMPAGTLAVGATLPEIGAEGYELTWYSDKACTVPVTTVADATAIYYCTAGTVKVAYGIKSITAISCSVLISDGTKNYIEGEGVLTGTVLTITGVPDEEGYTPYIFKVNGSAFTSGSTITVDDDIQITAIYYDGQSLPINPVFADNTWQMIREAFRSGVAATMWNVGDTKPVTLNDGNTYTIRIADLTPGRYAMSEGNDTTNGVLEFVECLPTSYAINNSAKEGQYTGGGWALCDMKNTFLGTTVWALLPDDLKQAISEISLNEYSYTSPSPRESASKLFLPAETEIFATRHYSAEGAQTNCPKLDQFGYYAAITTADGSTCVQRQKKKVNTTSSVWWWLRSPYSGNNGIFCIVGGSGSYFSGGAGNAGGVSPCFAI